MERIDTRGLSCPEPALMTKKALDSNSDYIEIIVDDLSVKGVQRFLESKKYKVECKEEGDLTILVVNK